MIAGIIWTAIGKPIIASYHFSRYGKTVGNLKHYYINKAICYEPDETIYRTYAALDIVDSNPVQAVVHANKMMEFFNGHTPLCATLANMGVVRLKTKNVYDEVLMYLKGSHWVLPSFNPIVEMLKDPHGVTQRSAIINPAAKSRICGEEAVWRLRFLSSEFERLKLEIKFKQQGEQDMAIQADVNVGLQIGLLSKDTEILNLKIKLVEAAMQNIVIQEKKKLNIPDSWGYDSENGLFLSPDEMKIPSNKEG